MLCDKKPYDTKKDARTAINVFKRGTITFEGRRRKIKILPIRAYYCKVCGKWHITSKEYDEYYDEWQEKKMQHDTL